MELYGNGNVVRIGEGTSIRGGLLVAQNGSKFEIGAGCLFSHDVELRTTGSHKIFDKAGIRINEDRDIVVGRNVWLGRGVLVLKGAAVAKGCIVGARFVVTASLPESTLAVGVPARVARSDVSWQE